MTKPPREESDMHPSLLSMIAWAAGASMYGDTAKRDPLEGVDIAAEAELVRQKKSRLSASLRREVLRRDENRADAPEEKAPKGGER